MRRSESVSRPRLGLRAFALVLLVVLVAVAILLAVTLRRRPVQPTVTVKEIGGRTTLLVDGVALGDDGFASRTQAGLEAHLPLLLHAGPHDVLQIGFGTGETTRAICGHPIDRLDCVEPVAAVIVAAPHFEQDARSVLDDPRVHVHVARPRDFVRDTQLAYDVIVSCPPHPVLARDGSLYTVEFFRDCARRLKPGGIFSTRIPTRDIRFDDLAVILRSLRQAFPFVYVWHSPLGRNTELIALALTRPTHPNAPIYAPYDALADRMRDPALAADLALVGLDGPVGLMSLYILGPREVNALTAASQKLNTDENAYIETVSVPAIEATAPGTLAPGTCTARGCPLEASAPHAHETDTLAAEKLSARTYAELIDARATGGVFLDLHELGDERGGQVVNQLAHRWWSSNRVFRGRLYELAGEPHRARAEWHRALRDDPTNEIARDLLGMTQRALDEANALADPAESAFRVGLYHLAHAEEDAAPDERTAQLDEAAAAFRQAISASEQTPDHSARLVASYDFLARTDITLDRLDDALEITSRLGTNVPCPSSDQLATALSAVVDALRRTTAEVGNAEAWIALAASAQLAQLDDLSVDAYQHALTIEPDRAAEIEKALASLEVLRGNFQQASEHAERAGDQDLLKQIYSWREHPIHPVAQRVLDHTTGEPSPATTDKEKAGLDEGKP